MIPPRKHGLGLDTLGRGDRHWAANATKQESLGAGVSVVGRVGVVVEPCAVAGDDAKKWSTDSSGHSGHERQEEFLNHSGQLQRGVHRYDVDKRQRCEFTDGELGVGTAGGDRRSEHGHSTRRQHNSALEHLLKHALLVGTGVRKGDEVDHGIERRPVRNDRVVAEERRHALMKSGTVVAFVKRGSTAAATRASLLGCRGKAGEVEHGVLARNRRRSALARTALTKGKHSLATRSAGRSLGTAEGGLRATARPGAEATEATVPRQSRSAREFPSVRLGDSCSILKDSSDGVRYIRDGGCWGLVRLYSGIDGVRVEEVRG